jgi:DHA3 family macrolide efflux protein-like MFS transporter
LKNRQAFRLLLAANAISGFAQGISMLSIPWYFGSVLNQSTLFNLSAGIITIATIFWSLYAGTLIDKYPRKKVFLIINTCGGLMLCSVAAVGYIQGTLSPGLVLFVFAGTLFIYSIYFPSLYAFGQEITEKENYGKMNSRLEIQAQATSMLAGAFGAVLLSGTKDQAINLLGLTVPLGFDIEKWQMRDIFLLDGSTYFLSLLLISAIRYVPVQETPTEQGTVIARIRSGFSFLKAHPDLFWFGNASYAVFVVLMVEVHLLLSPYVSRHLLAAPFVYTSAEIWYAIGALFAGLAIRRLFKSMHTVRAVIVMMFVTCLGLFVTAFTKSVTWFFAFSALIGVTNAGIRILRMTYLYKHIPNHIIGRASSAFNMINVFLRAVLSFVFAIPFFTEGNHVIYAYFTGGCFILLWIIPVLTRFKKLTTPDG